MGPSIPFNLHCTTVYNGTDKPWEAKRLRRRHFRREAAFPPPFCSCSRTLRFPCGSWCSPSPSCLMRSPGAALSEGSAWKWHSHDKWVGNSNFKEIYLVSHKAKIHVMTLKNKKGLVRSISESRSKLKWTDTRLSSELVTDWFNVSSQSSNKTSKPSKKSVMKFQYHTVKRLFEGRRWQAQPGRRSVQ